MMAVSEDDLTGLIEALDEGAAGYVYVIKLRRSDNKTFWYVGSVSSGLSALRKRIKDHRRLNGECAAPVQLNGREVLLGRRNDVRKNEYEFLGVESIDPVYDDLPRHIREIEREKAIEVALEKETTNVLGGK